MEQSARSAPSLGDGSTHHDVDFGVDLEAEEALGALLAEHVDADPLVLAA